MEKAISKQVAQLPNLARQQLLDLWVRLNGGPAPAGMRRELLVPFLAYRMQERSYGGLKSSTRAELRRIGQNLKSSRSAVKPLLRPRFKPGTRVVRHWQGKMHEVSVTASGFEYGGTAYGSLSQIAREITGTQWSGPAFFGLKNKTSEVKPSV